MQRLGIIAGRGNLPRLLVDACRRKGQDFFVLGLEGQADTDTMCDVPHGWGKLGSTNEAIRILKKNNVDTLVLAGSVRRPSLKEMKPEWRTLQVFAKLGAKAFGDDALLRAAAAELEKDGFKIIGAHEIEPSLITPEGVLGKVQPSADHRVDMEIAMRTAKAIGQMDVGQAAIVQQGIVLGLEAVEGTDILIERCAKLRRKGRGGVLAKACKPQQDHRLDLPAIGFRTVRKAYEAGIEGIAVEAGASLIIDREEVIAAADRLGMFIVGYKF